MIRMVCEKNIETKTNIHCINVECITNIKGFQFYGGKNNFGFLPNKRTESRDDEMIK
jgi:hypothetical protein